MLPAPGRNGKTAADSNGPMYRDITILSHPMRGLDFLAGVLQNGDVRELP